MKTEDSPENLTELLNEQALDLLNTSGVELFEKLGTEAIRTVIFDVLSGRNLRDSTEVLTRRRLAALNVAMVSMLLKGNEAYPNFTEAIPHIAERILTQSRLSKSERWVAQWLLGLTGKATQNVLRDDASLLAEYRERYVATCEEVIRESLETYGDLSGELQLGTSVAIPVSWKFMVYLLGAAGAQTLTIRGSEKSTYGKLFERLVLGALLSILGFKYTRGGSPQDLQKEFWLSSSQINQRESDATALLRKGQGVRFDIGFIGRGNPEISLDKVSRFAREVEIHNARWYMATIIIVDRIGPGSAIKEMARVIDGDIVQMSMGYWPQEVAQILNQRMDFEHPLVHMPRAELRSYLKVALQDIDLLQFLSGDEA